MLLFLEDKPRLDLSELNLLFLGSDSRPTSELQSILQERNFSRLRNSPSKWTASMIVDRLCLGYRTRLHMVDSVRTPIVACKFRGMDIAHCLLPSSASALEARWALEENGTASWPTGRLGWVPVLEVAPQKTGGVTGHVLI